MTLLLALAACQGPTVIGDCFTDSASVFPFDGERTWTYTSSDPAVSDQLVATSDGVPEEIDGLSVYTVRYAEGDADPVSIRWASRVGDGVHVYGFDGVDLDPPVVVTDQGCGGGRDPVITSTGGATWTSTLQGMFECPIAMNAQWDECARFLVETDGDGGPLAGTWWATKGNGVTAIHRAGEAGTWELADLTCDGDCDGTW